MLLSAIVKQAAWAAAMSSSGLVPSPSSNLTRTSRRLEDAVADGQASIARLQVPVPLGAAIACRHLALPSGRFGPDTYCAIWAGDVDFRRRHMGFIQPEPPPFDLGEWSRALLSRLKPVVQDWAVNGFGARDHLPAVRDQAGALRFRGGPSDLAHDGRHRGARRHRRLVVEPIVFQVCDLDPAVGGARARLGLDGAGGTLLATDRRRPLPPATGHRRLPPWPDKVPLTGGFNRTPVDVALYAGLLGSAIYLLVSDGETVAGTVAGRLDPAAIAVLFGFWGLLGLRDKVSFLAPRPEVYGFLLLVSFPGWEHDRRLAVRLLVHLAGGRVVEVQPPLPVRDRGDDQQHALESLAEVEGGHVPRLAQRRAPVEKRRARLTVRDRH